MIGMFSENLVNLDTYVVNGVIVRLALFHVFGTVPRYPKLRA